MDTLREIIFALDRYKVRHIEVLTNPRTPADEKESRYFEMYAGIRDNRWETEADMAAHFGMDPDGKSFTRFKNEVKKRLFNSALFIDTSLPEFTDYRRGCALVAQQWAVNRTLRQLISKNSILEFSERTLKLAEHYEIFDIALDIAQQIKNSLAHLPGMIKKYEAIQEKTDFFKKMYLDKLQVDEAYEQLIIKLLDKKGYKKEYAPFLRQKIAELQPLADNNQSIAFQGKFYLLKLYAETLQHNWTEALRISDEAKRFLRSKHFLYTPSLMSQLLQESGCHIMLSRFEDAEQSLLEAQTLVPEGSTAWFKIQEMRLVNAMYASDYGAAWRQLRAMLQHPAFQALNSLDQEFWRLYQGYLYFLARSGRLSLSPREKGDAEKFRLGSWVNSMSLIVQDKRGANIPVLIFQALFLLYDGRFDDFDNRVEALRKYRQRNLEPESEHFRTDCFIRLLENVTKCGYRLQPVEKASGPLLEKLYSVSNDLLDRSFEIEVVPYERQWEWVTDILKMHEI